MKPWLELEKLVNNRDFKRAEVLIAKRLRTVGTSDEKRQTLVYRAKLRLLIGRPNEALADLREANSDTVQTSSPEYLELLADAYFQQYELATVGFSEKNDLKLAQEAYTTIIQKYPEYSNRGWIHYQLGRLLLISALPVEAELHFRNALFEPSYLTTLTAFCYERLAYVSLHDLRTPRQALIYIDKAIATYPGKEPCQWLVQSLLLKSKIYQSIDLSQSLISAKEAHQIASKRGSGVAKSIIAETVLTVADVASGSRGLEHDVIEHAQHFLQLSRTPVGIDVTWARVHEMLGDSFLAQQRYKQAITAYQQMLQFNPYHPWDNAVKIRIAYCHYYLKSYAQAVELTLQIVTDDDTTDYATAYELLAYAYYGLDRLVEARHAWQQAVGHGISEPRYGARFFSS